MRLLVMGNIPVDVVMRLPALPRPGEDVAAESVSTVPGGSFHVLRAAARGGVPCAYAGAHGDGGYGDLVRAALEGIGVPTLQPPMTGRDTGLVLVLVDHAGERTFITAPDAVVPYSPDLLSGIRPDGSDLVYVSGYSLGLGAPSAALAEWVAGLPPAVPVFCDLGPRGLTAGRAVLAPVLGRVDWLSCNDREALLLTGLADPARAGLALRLRTSGASVLVRAGADGCWLVAPGADAELVPAPEVGPAVDTTGAGDTHSGAFLAALAQGNAPRNAVALANAAAASLVSHENVRG